MKASQYVANQIRHMCTVFKNRSSGSRVEWQCQDYIKEELGGYADYVAEQAFTVHPDAGWAWVVVAAGSGLLSIVLPLLGMQSTLLAGLAFACSALSVAVTVFQFLMGLHMLDRFFPKRKAKNIMAAAKPIGPTERRIVFTGHADAAYEMTYSHHGGAATVQGIAAVAVVGLVLMFLMNTVLFARHIIAGGIVAGSVWHWLRVASLLLIPAFTRALFFFNTKCVVDGANDNLSGCAVAMATLKEFTQSDTRLHATEICCLVTSSEECGLRGAHAFAKQNDLWNDGIETIYIVLDTLHDTNQLKVYTKGMNGFQTNSLEVAELIHESAVNLGLSVPVAGPYPGATDAEAFSKAGLKACALCGVDHTPQPYYHTRGDNINSIDEDCLGTCLELCVEIANHFDAQSATEVEMLDAV